MNAATAVASPDDQGQSMVLSDQDRAVLQNVDRALSDGLCLKNWWEEKEEKGDYANSFELVRTFNAPNRGIGFFDVGPACLGHLPVMGVVQEMCFDQPKRAAKISVRDEFLEFLWEYFMRVSSFHEPEAAAQVPGTKLPPELQVFSWFPENLETRVGFGYSQLYFKLKTSGVIGKIADQNKYAIFNLREIGRKYEWVVMKVQVFNFNLTFRPFGPNGISLALPVNEETYLVLSRDFMAESDNLLPKLEKRYGFGYALLKYSGKPSVFAYGPGHFGTGFQSINFDLLKSGEIRVRMTFVVNRPQKILNISIDPISWSFKIADLLSLGLSSRLLGPMKEALDGLPLRFSNFDPVTTYIALANTLTAGEAGRRLGISIEELEKSMLVQHFMEHYRMVVGSLLTWRQIPDWLDRPALPEWAMTGLGR